jgi:outer membrane protein OmpA-like peptidoglycan-associated protein
MGELAKRCLRYRAIAREPRAKVVARDAMCVLFSIYAFGFISKDCFAQATSLWKSNVDDSRPSLFFGASFSDNLTGAKFDAYDGTILCGIYNSGSKPGWNGLAGLTLPFKNSLSFNGAIQYRDLSTSFETHANLNPDPPARHSGVGDIPISRNRYFTANFSLLSFSTTISYELIQRLRITAGPYLGFFLKHSYSETEVIDPSVLADTDAYYYPSLQQTRTVGSGALDLNSMLQFGMSLGASYELPFQPNVGLRPSIGWIIPFTSIVAGYRNLGYISSLGGSLELVYHFHEPPVQEIKTERGNEIAETSEQLPSAPISPPAAPAPTRSLLKVSIEAQGVDADGRKVSEPVLSIERTHVTEVYPMLHYVFFDDGSAEIPQRYYRETASTRSEFDEKRLFTSNALEIHHHVLDILGKRLMENPKASIMLVGTRSEHSVKDASLGDSISRARAQSIQDYLANVWDISRDRIHIRKRGLPEVASDDRNPFGEAENRRVEIIPSTSDITSPLWTERIERVATPPSISFYPTIRANTGIRSATITVMQRGQVLRTIDALSDSASSEFLWTIDDHSMPDDRAPRDGSSTLYDSLTYRFSVVDSLSDTAYADGVIHLKLRSSDVTKHRNDRSYASDTSLDKQLERYSLILFDYSSSQLDKKESDRIVMDMASSVNDSTRMTLTGHTDKTGDDAFNERLARVRVTRAAEMLEAELKKLGKKEPDLTVESRGSRDELFDNSIPEGRVLSRTVRALIENETK